MITHIHHINFIVKDLDSATTQYRKRLNLGEFTYDELAQRAVKTARIKLGDTWLVLVQPLDQDSVPAKFLKENGEGFFLISLGTDDLAKQLELYEESAQKPSNFAKRQGLENWSIADLPDTDFFGAQFQLTEDSKHQ